MSRKRASMSAWARGADGKVRCDVCGREFDHPSQYRLAGDEVLCRGEKACAARKAAQTEQAKRAVAEAVQTAPHQQVNWNIHNIWDVRDHWVKVGSLGIALVKKYSSGWAIGPHEGMDIWTACRVLNDAGATKWLAYDPFEPYPSAQIWR